MQKSEKASIRTPGRVFARSAPIATLFLALGGCASLQPEPLTDVELTQQSRADRAAARANVEPITQALTLPEAQARALKYNLDRRVRLMEEALALRQTDLSRLDMLPKLIAQAGYTSRDRDRITSSVDLATGQVAPSRYLSQENSHTLSEFGVSWSLLDFGLGYYNARQASDRFLIASERRRRAMHLLMQDVRVAFWRAASAQKLETRLRQTVAEAEKALADARRAEAGRIRNPIDGLRYQRQLLENLRLLESITQELSAAQVDLAQLINAPMGTVLRVVEPSGNALPGGEVLMLPVESLEEAALMANADVREQYYNARIARVEARRTLLRLFPNVTFNYGTNYDTDRFQVNNQWNEAGIQLSFNVLNVFTANRQLAFAEAGIALADQRRVAAQMAVIAQVHLARLQLGNALRQYERAGQIYQTDQRLADFTLAREQAQLQSPLDRVSAQTAAILSELRRYQALAQAQAADARLEATLGVEPAIGSVSETSLKELVQQLSNAPRWTGRVAPASKAK